MPTAPSLPLSPHCILCPLGPIYVPMLLSCPPQPPVPTAIFLSPTFPSLNSTAVSHSGPTLNHGCVALNAPEFHLCHIHVPAPEASRLTQDYPSLDTMVVRAERTKVPTGSHGKGGWTDSKTGTDGAESQGTQDRQREPRPHLPCPPAPPKSLDPQPSYLVVPGTSGPYRLLLGPCCPLHPHPLCLSSLAGRSLPPFLQGRLLSSLPPPAACSGLQGPLNPAPAHRGPGVAENPSLLLAMGGGHSWPLPRL